MTTGRTLTGAVAAGELVKLASQGAYERGVAYYEEGRVAKLAVVGDRITARVDDTEAYDVRLRRTPLGFDGACTEVVTQVLGIVYRAISGHLIRKAGLTRASAVTGAVTLI